MWFDVGKLVRRIPWEYIKDNIAAICRTGSDEYEGKLLKPYHLDNRAVFTRVVL